MRLGLIVEKNALVGLHTAAIIYGVEVLDPLEYTEEIYNKYIDLRNNIEYQLVCVTLNDNFEKKRDIIANYSEFRYNAATKQVYTTASLYTGNKRRLYNTSDTIPQAADYMIYLSK